MVWLLENAVPPRPFPLFSQWYSAARDGDQPYPEGMMMATVGEGGVPSARMLLLKDVDERGFVFFTNYRSQKARELARNPAATLLFWWPEAMRQVRVSGVVERISPSESDDYHRTRERNARIGAWASPQSEVLPGRGALERAFVEVQARFEGSEVPRPQHWGGYRLRPDEYEFWQGRDSRLHDRLVYTLRADGEWGLRRLAP